VTIKKNKGDLSTKQRNNRFIIIDGEPR